MGTKIDQKAYLQKYLSGPSGDKKKKKKKVVKGRGFKIIDDDLDLTKLRPLEGDELDVFDEGEDAPQIAGIIDDRPEELKKQEQFKTTTKWKVINQDDGFNSKLQIEEIKKDVKEVEKENELIFGKMYSDSEDEKKDSDASPPRKQHHKKGNDSDASPPRKRQHDSEVSPARKGQKHKGKNTSDSDACPPRKRQHDSEVSPARKGRKHKGKPTSDSDTSPPRKRQNDSETSRKNKDVASKKRSDIKRHDNDSNASPTRGKIKGKDNSKRPNYDSDVSPPRRSRKEDSDESPPRKRQKDKGASSKRHHNDEYRKDDSDVSPPRKNYKDKAVSSKKHYKDNDSTRKIHKDSRKSHLNDDNSNTKNNTGYDSDLSPPRRRTEKVKERKRPSRWGDADDVEIKRDSAKSKQRSRSKSPKKSQGYDSDLSPPRKSRKDSPKRSQKSDKQKHRSQNSDSDLSPPPRNRRNSKDRKRKSVSFSPPRNDKDRYRNSDSPPPTNKKMARTLEGKMAGLQNAVQLREENEQFRRKEDEAFKKMTDDVSGRNARAVSRKGKRETSEDRQKQREKAERQKELDEKYKKWSKGIKQVEAQEARVQDYLHEASKPLARHKDDRDLEATLKDVERDGDPMLKYIREKKRERGELGPEKPTYKGSFPPNRFNIRPGYRWDGVDRSNGYEKKYFETQSKKKAQAEEAYKWSTEDL
ncbi:BUD13 homolog [Amyelois transitella]|uniref:BUD13 homolog n=1 Tax=Amyelois transitella TaxID=680683 RepID=UPI00067D32D1|nr:BUD13 homolog [Amyelois transitella]